jgi:AcrR family transcriptional regulator
MVLMSDAAELRGRRPGRPVDAALGPAILDAVLVLLAEQGYARLTTAAVAARAGVSTATLYRRWPSKRDLLLAAVEQIADAGAVKIDTGATESDLGELFAHKRRVLSGQVGAVLVALVGESAHDPELAGIVRKSIFDPVLEHLDAILERARARGERVVTEASSAARLVVGTVLARLAFDAATDASAPAAGGFDLLPESDAALLIRAISGYTGPYDAQSAR